MKLSPLDKLFTTNFILPDFDSLTWGQIFELREDKFIKSFRKSIRPYLEGTIPTEKAYSIKLQRDLWDFISEMKPSIMGSWMSGIFSNIPGLPFNPVGMALSAQDIEKNQQISNKFGHLFFIQNLGEKIEKDDWTKLLD